MKLWTGFREEHMANVSENDFFRQVMQKSGLSEAELREAIAEKQGEYSGLLTDEGALEVIARQKGIVKQAALSNAAPIELAKANQGESINALVRITRIFPPKRFEKNGRKGRVCNVSVRDASGEGTLVLWNDDVKLIEQGLLKRNDCLLLENVFVKVMAPLEIHSRLLTRVKPVEDEPGIPKILAPETGFADLAEGQGVDATARVIEKTALKKFVSKNGRERSVVRAVLSDGSQTRAAVFWGAAAERFAENFSEGDAIRIEGMVVKKNAFGELEVHVGEKSFVTPARGLLESKEDALGKLFPKKSVGELREGEQAIVSADITNVFDARVSRKCAKCGSREGDCACGAGLREVFFASAELGEGGEGGAAAGTRIRCVFFGGLAKKFLGINDSTTIDYETLLALKKNYLVGKRVTLVALPKTNSFSGALELTAKNILETI